MNKQYAPARVVNPTSLQHLVKLRPGQSFVLSLDKDLYKKPNIEIVGENLAMGVAETKDAGFHYTIVQRQNLDDWSIYSSCMLGEVWIECKNNLSKLVVVQDCLNPEKSDHLTVINPDHCDIRVQPHSIMEWVVYDKGFGYQDEWDWKWRPTMDNVVVEEMGTDTLGLYSWGKFQEYMEIDPPHYRYARFPRTDVEENKFCRQHHFWLRFNNELLSELNKDIGVQHVGDLDFFGYKNRSGESYDSRSFHASVYLDIKKKYRTRFLGVLGLKKRDEYSLYDHKHAQPSGGIAIRPHSIGSIVHVPKPKPISPVIKKVDISRMQPESLEDGCKVLSATPTSKVFNPYEDFVSYCNHRYHRKFHGAW